MTFFFSSCRAPIEEILVLIDKIIEDTQITQERAYTKDKETQKQCIEQLNEHKKAIEQVILSFLHFLSIFFFLFSH